MAQINNQYVVREENVFPSWIKDQMSKGRIKVKKDEDGKLLYVEVKSATKKYEAYPGDSIILLKSGLTVIKKQVAKKYSNEVKKEENKNEENQ